MTEKCKEEGCQLEADGVCPEHENEVERRKNLQGTVDRLEKYVSDLQESVEMIVSNVVHLKQFRKVAAKLNKMFWISSATTALIIAGLGITFAIMAHQDNKVEYRFSQIESEKDLAIQQSIDRDHLIIEMAENDRAMQTELVKATERVTIKLENVIERLEAMEDN